MSPEQFFLNGAVMSMPSGQTYFGQNLKLLLETDSQNSEASEAFFLNPTYDLKKLNHRFVPTHYSSDASFIKSVSELTSASLLTSESNSKTVALEWSADWDLYKQTYDQFQNFITNGVLKKAVPFISFKATKPKDFNKKYLPFILAKLLQFYNKDQFLYGLWDQTSGFIGQTPEILFESKGLGNTYETMALAGTLPAIDQTDMLLDVKLKEEHQMVIQDITSKLAGLDLKWSQVQEKIYGSIKHLHARLEFTTTTNITKLITRLAPTAAVGVFPAENWKRFGNLLQVHERGSYGAPFGLITAEESRVVVCLRGLFWDTSHLYIHVGGGITALSEYPNEVNELKLKFASTKTKLGL